MPKIANEQEELYKSKIQDLIVLRSRVSAREISKALNIDKDYAQKLIKEVLSEAKEEVDGEKVLSHLAQANLAFNLVSDRLFTIAVGKDSTTHEKVTALREAGKNKERQFKLMFDAGIFKRQLGSLSIGEDKPKTVSSAELLEVILNTVDANNRELIVNTVSDYLERNSNTPAIPS